MIVTEFVFQDSKLQVEELEYMFGSTAGLTSMKIARCSSIRQTYNSIRTVIA